MLESNGHKARSRAKLLNEIGVAIDAINFSKIGTTFEPAITYTLRPIHLSKYRSLHQNADPRW